MAQAERSLIDLAVLVDKPPRGQPDEVSHAMARFLVIRTCGYLEQTVEDSCRALVVSKSSPMVASYGNSWLGRGASPSPANLVALVQRFDHKWSEELYQLFADNDEFLSRETKFLVNRRNKIAHGLSEGIGARKALDLVESTAEVAEWFLEKFDPR
ncbi:MAG: hypothetical protein HIU84_08055 [Acidobacteria bacterium]|nr:hypothetical protein [Acidobacteriota bacterium]